MMRENIIRIEWEGPFTVDKVIKKKNDGGKESDNWAGLDYGLYQIYGDHILCKRNTLLYIGKACDQTFSQRFRQHKKEWLKKEKNIKVYLGRIEDSEKYTEKNNWSGWDKDVDIAEAILIYKYTPNYNSSGKGEEPKLMQYEKIRLVHSRNKHKLLKEDIAPRDYS